MASFRAVFRKSFYFPSPREYIYLARRLSRRNKIALVAFIALFLIGIFGTLFHATNSISVDVPIEGGVIHEGIIGTPRFINPILALSDADRDMVALVYSGLLRSNNQGKLLPDLAEKYTISDDGRTYVFTLKHGLKWHDGKPLTAEDVLFTIKQAQDPSVKSPKRASWEGVLAKAIDDYTISFTLDRPYAPFLEGATIGILPKHIWESAAHEQMIFSDFNTRPIGTGPYKVAGISRGASGIITAYTLERNTDFVLGVPYIKKVIVHFYSSEEKLVSAYKSGVVSSIGSISPTVVQDIIRRDSIVHSLMLPRVFAAFFNQNQAPIFAAKEVRIALNRATDKEHIIDTVLKGFGTPLDYPIPPGTFGAIDETLDKPYDPVKALDEARDILIRHGWAPNKEDGVLEKNNLRLEFSIATADVPELVETATLLKSMWEAIGAHIDVHIFEIGNLNQNVIRPRRYDVLLFGTIAGRDPDPFAFWHSSQRNDPGLNVALYANITVDKLLEDARSSVDENERSGLYKKFQKEVARDMPAVFLYSPRFIYVTPDTLHGVQELKSAIVPSERFSQIHTWYINTQKIWNIFIR